MPASIGPYDLFAKLDEMAEKGSSVVLTWGEDAGAWECSWITGGVRYTSVQGSPLTAVGECLEKAYIATAGRNEERGDPVDGRFYLNGTPRPSGAAS